MYLLSEELHAADINLRQGRPNTQHWVPELIKFAKQMLSVSV